MSNPPMQGPEQPTEEEMRAAFEEQLRELTPADLIVQTVVTLINLAGRRLGLIPGGEGERDLGQVRDAIDGVRALLPVLERGAGSEALGPLRDALAALQVEYTKLTTATAAAPPAQAAAAPETPAESGPTPEGPGPAQSSGRLWVPGS